MTKLPPIIWSIIRKLKLGWMILLAHPKSILIQDGWFASFHSGKPVDRHGRPLPWNTYGFLKFIEKRIKSEFSIFEYGCGFSTLWYGSRVSKVVAVEHDTVWIKQISTHLPKNCQVIHRVNPQEYVNEISGHGIFDLIIIDGLKGNCAGNLQLSILPQGVSSSGTIPTVLILPVPGRICSSGAFVTWISMAWPRSHLSPNRRPSFTATEIVWEYDHKNSLNARPFQPVRFSPSQNIIAS